MPSESLTTAKDSADESDELVQVVVSNFPKTLLDEIEIEAKRNNRTRTAEIRHQLAERAALRRQRKAA